MSELSQVVVDPADATDELINKIRAHVMGSGDLSRKEAWRVFTGKALHRFGKHTMVPMKMYDAPSDRIINTGWRVCLFCSRVQS